MWLKHIHAWISTENIRGLIKNYLTRERRRFSAAMMWSVDVGIQRREEGQNDQRFAPSAVADELICSAIFTNEFDNLLGPMLMRLMQQKINFPFYRSSPQNIGVCARVFSKFSTAFPRNSWSFSLSPISYFSISPSNCINNAGSDVGGATPTADFILLI